MESSPAPRIKHEEKLPQSNRIFKNENFLKELMKSSLKFYFGSKYLYQRWSSKEIMIYSYDFEQIHTVKLKTRMRFLTEYKNVYIFIDCGDQYIIVDQQAPFEQKVFDIANKSKYTTPLTKDLLLCGQFHGGLAVFSIFQGKFIHQFYSKALKTETAIIYHVEILAFRKNEVGISTSKGVQFFKVNKNEGTLSLKETIFPNNKIKLFYELSRTKYIFVERKTYANIIYSKFDR